jgi:hypothetical protein
MVAPWSASKAELIVPSESAIAALQLSAPSRSLAMPNFSRLPTIPVVLHE